MAKLEEALRGARGAGRPILVGYVMGGIRPDWTDLLTAMVDAGADAVEIGLPFSDPMLDGGTIQEASAVALDAGARISDILDRAAILQPTVPLIAMTYANHVYSRGVDTFCAMLADAGISGTIVPDLPLDEAEEYLACAAARHVDAILLASPATSRERLPLICSRSRGFIYSVSVMGTTGGAGPGEDGWSAADRARALTDTPVLIGFGVNTPEIAAHAVGHADGVIVASALMRRVLDGGSVGEISRAVGAIRSALDQVAA
ncbi:MAG: tryptophan synthase subunit alpha [Jatrophihabitans sp.]